MKFPHPNANQVAVIPCNEPQLVVVRGLLLDQQQRWETGGTRSVLQSRIARASYGVVVREAYVPTRHLDEDVQEDRFSKGQKFAINQIQWLIRKGDPVSPNTPLVKSFEIRLAEGEVTRKWASKIVVSQNEPGFLPTSMKKRKSSRLISDLSSCSLLLTLGAASSRRPSRRRKAMRRPQQPDRCAAEAAGGKIQAGIVLQQRVQVLCLPIRCSSLGGCCRPAV